MDAATEGRVLAKLEYHDGLHEEHKADIKAEAKARQDGDEKVHHRINGIFKLAVVQVLGLALTLLVLLLKR